VFAGISAKRRRSLTARYLENGMDHEDIKLKRHQAALPLAPCPIFSLLVSLSLWKEF
jgi:hypothetical protein